MWYHDDDNLIILVFMLIRWYKLWFGLKVAEHGVIKNIGYDSCINYHIYDPNHVWYDMIFIGYLY